MKATISSKNAAEILNVTESTIKRWADDGYLKCFKTPGGHRKFLLKDIQHYESANTFAASITKSGKNQTKLHTSVYKKDYLKLSNNLESLLLKGEYVKSYDFLFLLYLNNYEPEEIFDKVVKLTMHRIGEKWHNNLIGVENEHIASYTLAAALHQFDKTIVKNKSNGRTALCAAIDNEFHETGLLCVKIFLNYMGYKVIYPGANLPFSSLVNLIKKENPHLLCISSILRTDNSLFEDQIKNLIKLTINSKTKLVIGGNISLSKEFKQYSIFEISDLKKYFKKQKK